MAIEPSLYRTKQPQQAQDGLLQAIVSTLVGNKEPALPPQPAMGFFTDTSLCIGCKACEVACKQWNQLPANEPLWTGSSYDNTGQLTAITWRHVQFIEQVGRARKTGDVRAGDLGVGDVRANEARASETRADDVTGNDTRAEETRTDDVTGNDTRAGETRTDDVTGNDTRAGASPAPTIHASSLPSEYSRGDPRGRPGVGYPDPGRPDPGRPGPGHPDIPLIPPGTALPFFNTERWLMQSDVCKHCANAPCQEACPTGAIIRTEFDTVYVQQDICNGCGYCVVACPFGVIARDDQGDHRAHKCTLCYDRLKDGMEPACAKVCPTNSIQFGEVQQLKAHARERLGILHERGLNEARLYGVDDNILDGGLNSFFLLLDEPEVYNLPENPRRPSNNVAPASFWTIVAAAILGLLGMLFFRE